MIGISKLYCGSVEPSDVLRYKRRSAQLPSGLLQFSRDKKPVASREAHEESGSAGGAPFDSDNPFDGALVRWLQEDVTGEEPFCDATAFIRERTGAQDVGEQDVLARLRELKANGTMRRFGAMVRHRKMSYTFNAMAVWDAAEADVDAVGSAFAALPFVSNCYCRPRCERWPYDLYTVVHARTQEQLDAQLAEMEALTGIVPKVLVSRKEYKKSTPVYFPDSRAQSD